MSRGLTQSHSPCSTSDFLRKCRENRRACRLNHRPCACSERSDLPDAASARTVAIRFSFADDSELDRLAYRRVGLSSSVLLEYIRFIVVVNKPCKDFLILYVNLTCIPYSIDSQMAPRVMIVETTSVMAVMMVSMSKKSFEIETYRQSFRHSSLYTSYHLQSKDCPQDAFAIDR